MESYGEHAPESQAPTTEEVVMDALIAEDHEALANALLWALQRILPGWDIQKTSDGRTALYVLCMDPGVQFAVLDYLLPHSDADDIVSEVLKVRPHLRGKIIVCSGIVEYPEDVEQRLFTELGCKRLDKGNPKMLFELERIVLEVTGSRTQ